MSILLNILAKVIRLEKYIKGSQIIKEVVKLSVFRNKMLTFNEISKKSTKAV